MEKYDFIKCMNLHKKLKDKIKGNIFISINENNIMIININGPHRLRYRSVINDIPKDISIDKLADKIECDYKNFIMETYLYVFYKEVNKNERMC